MSVIAFCSHCPPPQIPEFHPDMFFGALGSPEGFITGLIIAGVIAVAVIMVMQIDKLTKDKSDETDDEIIDMPSPSQSQQYKEIATSMAKPLRLVNKKQSESKWNDFIIPTNDLQKIVVPVASSKKL